MSVDRRLHQATGTGALDCTLAPGRPWQLEEIRLHLNAAGGAGNFTATIDAIAGAAYDLVILTQDMTAATDVLYQPTRPLTFAVGDKLGFAWANAGSKTYGLEVIWLPI